MKVWVRVDEIECEITLRTACSEPGCGRPFHARGLCARHYAKARASGMPALTEADRFWSKVCKGAPSECWEWTGGWLGQPNKDGKRYGSFGRSSAHRWAYLNLVGELGPGEEVCHHCDNPPCVNPSHLFAGTRSDNVRDCVEKGRWRHGPAHPPSRWKHGRITTYNHYKCRCDECRQAHRDYERGVRERRRARGIPPDAKHGSVTTYGAYGCRCDACRTASNEARRLSRQRRQRRAA